MWIFDMVRPAVIIAPYQILKDITYRIQGKYHFISYN